MMLTVQQQRIRDAANRGELPSIGIDDTRLLLEWRWLPWMAWAGDHWEMARFPTEKGIVFPDESKFRHLVRFR
jgi:hypothetical protein